MPLQLEDQQLPALKPVKTYLRSSMTEERLNNCLLVHVYKEIAEELDLEAISRDFVRADDAHTSAVFDLFSLDQ